MVTATTPRGSHARGVARGVLSQLVAAGIIHSMVRRAWFTEHLLPKKSKEYTVEKLTVEKFVAVFRSISQRPRERFFLKTADSQKGTAGTPIPEDQFQLGSVGYQHRRTMSDVTGFTCGEAAEEISQRGHSLLSQKRILSSTGEANQKFEHEYRRKRQPT